MSEKVHQTEFAKRACRDEGQIRRDIASGKIVKDKRGLLDLEQLKLYPPKRPYRRKTSDKTEIQPGETPEQAAERIVIDEGHAPYTMQEALRVEKNYQAKLRELEFDMKSGAVVLVEDVAAMVSAEYAIIRNRLLSLSAEIAPNFAILRTAPEIQAAHEACVAELLESLTLDAGADHDIGSTIRQRKGKAH